MTDEDKLAVAKNCQAYARFLAPYQNQIDVRLAPKSLFRRVLWWLFPPRPADLSALQVEMIVSNLLSAGNMLEQVVRESKKEKDDGTVSATGKA